MCVYRYIYTYIFTYIRIGICYLTAYTYTYIYIYMKYGWGRCAKRTGSVFIVHGLANTGKLMVFGTGLACRHDKGRRRHRVYIDFFALAVRLQVEVELIFAADAL